MQQSNTRHPTWCDGAHLSGWTAHALSLGTVALSAALAYSVLVVQHLTAETPHVELDHIVGNTSELTNFTLEEADQLSRKLALAVRLALGVDEDPDSPVIAEVAHALRVLGCVTRPAADGLLGRSRCELTQRERVAVLGLFANGGAR